MIVNSAMLTMKTDEIGAAIWSQKAQQQMLVQNLLYVFGSVLPGVVFSVAREWVGVADCPAMSFVFVI